MYTIIGAGIGGLTTALAFEKLNIKYHLYEKSSGINAVGAGIWLAPNALKVYEWLGILDQIIDAGNSIDRITITTPNLEPLADSMQDKVKEEYGYSTIAIHRAVLQEILVRNIPDESISWNKELQSYKEDKTKVQLTFNDGYTVETPYVVAADGINSAIRKQLFPESTIRYSGQTCWRGVTTHSLDSDFDYRGLEIWGNQVRFGLSKVSKDTTYWFAVAKSKPFLKDNKETLKEELANLFSGFAPILLELINNTEKSKIIRNDIIDLKPMKKWFSKRICLIGDAGHATTPNMGQGGAQAIEDAYFLAKMITTEKEENVFKRFQEIRNKKVRSIVKQSWVTGKIAHIRYGASLRNLFFKNIPKSIINKKMHFIYQLDE